MTWRPSERKRGNAEDDRPELTAVLDYYDVRYNADKVRQMILCPVHEERGPSCSLDLDRQLWNCMSCGKAGSAWDLIMEKEGCDFRGARAFAASKQFTAGGAGGSDSGLSGSAYGGRRKIPSRSRRGSGGGGYVPAWRRRGSDAGA